MALTMKRPNKVRANIDLLEKKEGILIYEA
jgi:hypothetical protein